MSSPDSPFPPAPVPGALAAAEVVVDPVVLARLVRLADTAPPPGPAAARLVDAARGLAAALVTALPAAADRTAGGRSAALARALAEEWEHAARSWVAALGDHRERLAGVVPAFAAVDGSSATTIAHGVGR